jgi:putative ABC transport system ATP-binding protein
MIMIQLRNIEKVYKTDTVETLALHRINMEIDKGEFLSVMGPSGCGKSTLLNIMGLLDAPSKGEVKISDQATGALSDKQLAFQVKFYQSYHLINDSVLITLSCHCCAEITRLERTTTKRRWQGPQQTE